jgi:hypothetical protein
MIRKRRSKPRAGRLEGAELENLRRACFNRANGRCEECDCFLLYRARYDGDPIAYDMAHIRNKRMYGDNLGNVKALCHECHMDSHNAGGKPIKITKGEIYAGA